MAERTGRQNPTASLSRHWPWPCCTYPRIQTPLLIDLRDTAQFTTGRFRIRAVPMDLVTLVREVIELHQSTTTDHRLILESPDRMYGEWDRERLGQLLAIS
jgi:hypothetical protein